MRIKCTVMYDGGAYNGYQRQPGTKTIQGTIEEVLKQITNEEIIIYASGRTDALVNSRGQVFHFDTNIKMGDSNWKRAMNSLLPDDIYIKKVEFVSDDFHARFSMKSKEYRYYINTGEFDPFINRYSFNAYNLDINKMKEAISLFRGTHDFKGFAGDTSGKDTTRTIYDCGINVFDNQLEIFFIGNGFLKYMVRIMVGTIVEIGLGKKKPEIISEIFETNNRNLAGKTIDARGLFLYEVKY